MVQEAFEERDTLGLGNVTLDLDSVALLLPDVEDIFSASYVPKPPVYSSKSLAAHPLFAF